MKTWTQWILLLAALLLAACKNQNTPENTAVKFLNSLYNYDFEMAKSISTRNTWAMLHIMDARTQDVPEEIKQKNIGKLKVKVVDTREETDSTVIVYFSTEPDFQIFRGVRVLRQEDEEGRPKYRIDMTSTDSLTGFDDAIIEEEILPIQEDSLIAE